MNTSTRYSDEPFDVGAREAPLVAALDGFSPEALTVDITFRVERLVPFLRALERDGIGQVIFAGAVTRPRLGFVGAWVFALLAPTSSVVVIHTEVEFVPLYEGQPLFGDVDVYLRAQGDVVVQREPRGGEWFLPRAWHRDAQWRPVDGEGQGTALLGDQADHPSLVTYGFSLAARPTDAPTAALVSDAAGKFLGGWTFSVALSWFVTGSGGYSLPGPVRYVTCPPPGPCPAARLNKAG